MKTIYKYEVEITDIQTISVPRPAHVLSVAAQGSPYALSLWALVGTDSEPVDIEIRIVGTGNPFPDDDGTWTFLDTAQNAGLVWHVFYRWAAHRKD